MASRRQPLVAVAEDGANWQAQTGDPMLVLALASGAPVKEAAERAGVSERTAWRRLQDDGFRRCVAEAKADLVAQATAKLADGAAKAVTTLLEVMDSEDPRARVMAAKEVLALALPLRGAFASEAHALRPTRRVPYDSSSALLEQLETREEALGPERALPDLLGRELD